MFRSPPIWLFLLQSVILSHMAWMQSTFHAISIKTCLAWMSLDSKGRTQWKSSSTRVSKCSWQLFLLWNLMASPNRQKDWQNGKEQKIEVWEGPGPGRPGIIQMACNLFPLLSQSVTPSFFLPPDAQFRASNLDHSWLLSWWWWPYVIFFSLFLHLITLRSFPFCVCSFLLFLSSPDGIRQRNDSAWNNRNTDGGRTSHTNHFGPRVDSKALLWRLLAGSSIIHCLRYPPSHSSLKVSPKLTPSVLSIPFSILHADTFLKQTKALFKVIAIFLSPQNATFHLTPLLSGKRRENFS